MARRRAVPGMRRPSAVPFASILVAMALLLLAPAARVGAVARTPGQIPTDRPTRVLAVGDSVMLGAAGSIPAACPGCEVVVDAEESRSTATSVDAALGHGVEWDVVVVLLAHNDGGSPGAYRPAFERLFEAHAATSRVVVMTIHEARPYYADVNAFLREQAEVRPNVEVLDWHAVVAADGGTVVGDGLHLTGHGSARMAEEVAAAVDLARVELAPTTTTAPPPSTAPSTSAPDPEETGTTTAGEKTAPPRGDGTSEGSGTEEAPVDGPDGTKASGPKHPDGGDEGGDDGARSSTGPLFALGIASAAGAAVMVTRRRRAGGDGFRGGGPARTSP